MTRCCWTGCQASRKHGMQRRNENGSSSATETPGDDRHNQSHAM